MITRIEIDGYKSFERFELDLFPFTVIAGSNAVGKSNLFDVFRHISKLVTKTLREAFETERGSLLDLFTIYPDGSHKPTIRYAIEMLLPASVQDEFSVEATLKYLRLRYELAVTYNEDGHLTLLHESLKPIKREDDNFLKIYPNVKKLYPKSQVDANLSLTHRMMNKVLLFLKMAMLVINVKAIFQVRNARYSRV